MVDDQEVELAVKLPNNKVMHEAQLEFARVFAEAIARGALVKTKLEDYLRKQNIWDEAKQKEYNDLNNTVEENELSLKRGGIKLNDAKKLAIDMRIARMKLRNLLSERLALDANTAEGQAENARFNYLVSKCLVYNEDEKLFYKDVDEYNESHGEIPLTAARILTNLMWGYDDNYESNLPENKFLKEWNFVDDKLRLVNKQGKLVDIDGKLINEMGEYVDENGKILTDSGKVVEPEPSPFLDDDGNPITKDEPKTTVVENTEDKKPAKKKAATE